MFADVLLTMTSAWGESKMSEKPREEGSNSFEREDERGAELQKELIEMHKGGMRLAWRALERAEQPPGKGKWDREAPKEKERGVEEGCGLGNA